MLVVKKVDKAGNVVVSTRGLRRVVNSRTGRILDELVTVADAKLVAGIYNEATRTKDAKVISYPSLAKGGGA